MSQIVLTSLYNRLVSQTGAGTVHALVGGRIYQIEAPQGVTLPCLVFSISGNDTEIYMGTAVKSRQQLTATFVCFFKPDAAAAVATAMAAEAALFTLLNRVSMTPSDASYTSIESYVLTRGVPDIGEDFISVETTYRIIAIKDT